MNSARTVIEQGNIDLSNRPRVANADGTVSTVRSISIGENGQEVLIPTVSPDGRILSNSDAVALYHRTGQHLGKFSDVATADSAAKAIHNSQAAMLAPPRAKHVSPFYLRYLNDQANSIRERGGDDTAVSHFLDIEEGKPFAGQVSGPKIEDFAGDETPTNLRGTSMALVQGATFGFGDEALGSLLGLATGVGARQGIDEYRKEYADWAEKNHGKAVAAEIVGGVLPALATLGGTAEAGLLGRGVAGVARAVTPEAGAGIGGAARAGMLTGAAYGAGNSEGGITDRTWGALTGGTVGAATGTVIGGLGHFIVAPVVDRLAASPIGKAVVTPVENAINKRFGRTVVSLTPESRARDRLAQELLNENIDANLLEQRLADLHRAGVPATVLDGGGDKLLGLARGVLNDRSPLTTDLVHELEVRQAEQGTRLPAALLAAATKRNRFGVANATEVMDALHAKGLADAAPHYEAAHEQVVQLTPRMRKLLEQPDIKRAYNAGAEIARNEDLSGIGHGLGVTDLGDAPVPTRGLATTTKLRADFLKANPGSEHLLDKVFPMPSAAATADGELPARGLDYMQRGLKLIINGRYKEGTIDAQGAKALIAMRDELMAETERQVPALAKARTLYSGPVKSRDAIEAGMNMLRTAPPDIAKAMQKLAPADRDFARLGYIQSVYEAISKSSSKNVAESFFGGNLFGKPSFRMDQIRALFPDAPAAAESFARTLAGETRVSYTTGRAISPPGAITVQKLEQSAVGDLPGGYSPTSAAVSAGRKALQRFRAKVSKDEADELTHLFSKGLTRDANDTGVIPRQLRVLIDDLRYHYDGIATKRVIRGASAKAATQAVVKAAAKVITG